MRVFLGLAVLASLAFVNAVEDRPPVPKKLIINGQHWNVFEVQVLRDDPAMIGYTDCKPQIIEIKKGETDWLKADTLVHEAMHAMTRDDEGMCHDENWDNTNDEDDPHPGIYWGAGRIADFIADNPQAVEYIHWARTRK